MADCIFCKIARREIPANIVWEDDEFVAFLDVKPINPGHLLIIPKDHADTVFAMADEDYAAIFPAAKRLAEPLRRAAGAKLIGHPVEGFGVAHAHVHLVPLNGPGELNPERARAAEAGELKEMAEKIKIEIEKVRVN